MSINFSELVKKAEAAGFSLLPDGPYTVTVDKAEATQASTGKPMIKLVLIVADGPSKGRKLWFNMTLTMDNDNALRFFFEHMAAFGFDKTYWTSPSASLAHVAAQLPGRRVTAIVGNREYPKGSGQVRNEVQKVQAVAGAPNLAPVVGAGPAVNVAPTVDMTQAVPPVQQPVEPAPVVPPVHAGGVEPF